MLNGIMESLLEDKKFKDENTTLSEMVMDDEDDRILDSVDNTVISPSEEKKLNGILKKIPDTVDESEPISSKDIKAAKKVADPTVGDIVKESYSVESLYSDLIGGTR